LRMKASSIHLDEEPAVVVGKPDSTPHLRRKTIS
jgi:hypothetical protein